VLCLIDSHVVIEMISFFIYICLSSLSLCTTDSSINHHLSHPHLIVSSAVIEWVWRCTCRLWSSEVGGVLGSGRYLMYAVLGVKLWSWHEEIERDDLTSCFLVMVELSTRKREIRGDGGNHHEKLGHKRVSCASQLTIPDTAGTRPDPACDYTYTRSSKPNQASRTCYVS